ncbi:MAG: YeeE/YedE family protein [Pseudomonadales bacterium]|nr:YeeE/YedE family protein [Pseudomonadales bacterium]
MMDTLFPLGISQYLIGGLTIGFAVSFLFVTTGLIGGMSSFYSSTLSFLSSIRYFQQAKFINTRNWRLVYALGLILGGVIWVFTVGEPIQTQVTWWQLSIGGFISGYGARLSGGCTSGHGICGLASLQVPSLLAVVIFMSTAIISANVVQLMGGT